MSELSHSRDNSMNTVRLNRDQLESILQHTADAITVQDAQGNLIFANDSAAELTGFSSVDDLIGASAEERRNRYLVFDEKGEPLPPDRWPGHLVLESREAHQAILRFRVLGTADDRWSIAKAEPIFDQDGSLQYVVTATQDVTDVMHGEERLRLLADASEFLASSTDFDETLAKVARLAVPRFADWASVDLVEEGGRIRRLAIACADPATEERARQISAPYPTRLDFAFGAGRVIQTGVPVLLPEVTEVQLREADLDSDSLKLLTDRRLCSVIVVPLRARGRVLGAITFMALESGRHYVRSDLTLAIELASHAALAVDNARLYAELRDALSARDRVMSSVSHDLRTPLTTIRGMAQVLLRRVDPVSTLSSPQVMERLSLLDRAASQMSILIDDILDLARLEAGRPLDLNTESLDLVALVSRTVDRLRDEGVGSWMAVEAEGGEVTGVWDARRLERVLRSLMSHAAKLGPPSTSLTVRVSRPEVGHDGLRWAEVAVIDAGDNGNSTKNEPPTAERYIVSDIDIDGARRIIEQHGGTLIIGSEDGKSAAIRMRLPLG
jgi:signal transduction histidine kinase